VVVPGETIYLNSRESAKKRVQYRKIVSKVNDEFGEKLHRRSAGILACTRYSLMSFDDQIR
jgi:hypothetical protein